MRMLSTPQPWRAVQAVAARHDEAMRRHVLRLWSSPLPGLEKALATGRVSPVLQCVAAAWAAPSDTARERIAETSYRALAEAGDVTVKTGLTARMIPSLITAERRPAGTVSVGMAFDKTNPKATSWARKHAGELVTNLNDSQRKAVNRVVVNGFAKQQTPRQMATQIRQTVGMTVPQQAKYERLLEEKGAKKASAYAKKAVSDRAWVIARTETLRASNEGQMQAWEQAISKGRLTGRENRQWITTYDDRTCPTCAPMDGQVIPMQGNFDTGTVGLVRTPPAHPRCRCAMGLTFSEVTTKVEAPPAAVEPEPDQVTPPLDVAPVPEVTTPTRVKDAFTDSELNTIREYQNGAGVNIPLRQGTWLTDQLEKQVVDFDNAMAKSTTTAARSVYRAYNPMFQPLSTGMEFVDRGYVSTTMKHEPWLQGFGTQVLEIRVPRGIGAVDVNAALGERSIYGWQNELLLERDLEFRVIEELPDRIVVEILGKAATRATS